MLLEVDAVSDADYQAFLSGAPPPGTGPPVAEKVSGVSPTITVAEGDDLKFQPSSATAKVGDVVEWSNNGTAIHNVTFDSPQVPSSETQNGGDKFELKFATAGTYHYVCTFHEAVGMQGTITVTAG
jgi:plastocyanin